MTQKSRPICPDIYEGQWTPTPIYPQIDEVNPNDLTAVTSGADGDYFVVPLAALISPGCGSQQLTVRLRKIGGNPSAAVVLLQGTRMIASQTFYPTDDFANYTFALTQDQIGSITDYSNLRLKVVSACTGGLSYFYFTAMCVSRQAWLQGPLALSYQSAHPPVWSEGVVPSGEWSVVLRNLGGGNWTLTIQPLTFPFWEMVFVNINTWNGVGSATFQQFSSVGSPPTFPTAVTVQDTSFTVTCPPTLGTALYGNSAPSGGDVTLVPPGGGGPTTAGSVLIAYVAGVTGASFGITMPAGWVLVGSFVGFFGGNHSVMSCYKYQSAPSTSAVTVSYTGFTPALYGVVLEILNATDVDQFAQWNGSPAPPPSLSGTTGTTTAANEMSLACFQSGETSAPGTATGGYSLVLASPYFTIFGVSVYSKTLTATGTQSTSINMSLPNGMIVTVK
jgi:hypothetical protein